MNGYSVRDQEPAQQRNLRFGVRTLLFTITLCCSVLGLLLSEMPLAAGGCVLIAGCFFCRKQARVPRALGWLLIAAALIWGIGVIKVRSMLGVGPIYFRDDWPSGLAEMDRLAGSNDWRINAQRTGGFLFDSEYVFRLPVDKSRLAAIQKEFSLLDSTLDARSAAKFRSQFPWWWRPHRTEATRYMITSYFDVHGCGPDGDHYGAWYDAENEWLYVWLKANF